MSRTPAQVQSEMLQLMPPGYPFEGGGFGVTSSYVAARLLAPATEMALAEASMEALLPQVDPRVAFDLLPAYIAVLGPDPCGLDISSLPFAEAAALTYARWTAGGNICAGYFEALAASLGTTCTVTECVCWECGVAGCDDEMVTAPENFVVVFGLPTDSITNWECGVATCDDSLGTFVENIAQCPIEHQVPAHIIPVFSYTLSES
jgi:uncharacterized protein YmfQ (DUF2313 family)